MYNIHKLVTVGQIECGLLLSRIFLKLTTYVRNLALEQHTHEHVDM